ncbi:DUF1127 domain-containing protein [Variovorax paradoxus]|uniref:DUF1127 domain-containing protein n=1 Tax=Variovorax paradoxus TaxID=34073 RepID=UPI0030D5F39E
MLRCIYDAVRRACRPRWPGFAWRRVADALRKSHRRAAARRELRSIDEHTLRDIGLSHRAAAEWPRQRDAW